MKPRILQLMLSLLFAVSALAQQTGDSLARVGMMRVQFDGFEEVANPESLRKEYVFMLRFIDLAIPKQPLVLRRGDRVAGYTIGEFIKREPVILPSDGIKAGTQPTLQIIHTESGEKHVLEPMCVYVVSTPLAQCNQRRRTMRCSELLRASRWLLPPPPCRLPCSQRASLRRR